MALIKRLENPPNPSLAPQPLAVYQQQVDRGEYSARILAIALRQSKVAEKRGGLIPYPAHSVYSEGRGEEALNGLQTSRAKVPPTTRAPVRPSAPFTPPVRTPVRVQRTSAHVTPPVRVPVRAQRPSAPVRLLPITTRKKALRHLNIALASKKQNHLTIVL